MARRAHDPAPPRASLAGELVRLITSDPEALALLASKLSAHVTAENEPVDQTALPPVIPVRAFLAACRAGKVVGAVKHGRRWVTTRGALTAWWRGEGAGQDVAKHVAPANEDDAAMEALRAAGFDVDAMGARKALGG